MFKNCIDLSFERPLEEAHTDEGHFYKHKKTGKLYTSITTIFKLLDKQDWYDGWVRYIMKSENLNEEDARKRCKEIGKNSMKVGTELHRLAEEYAIDIEAQLYNPDKYEKNPMELFKPLKKWMDENIDEVYGVEYKLHSDVLELAGTVDLIAKLKTGEIAVIDYKNSRKPKTPGKIKDAHYYEQATAYSIMVEEQLGIKIDKIMVVVVSWDGKVRAFESIPKKHESDLWDWILKYEEYKALNS